MLSAKDMMEQMMQQQMMQQMIGNQVAAIQNISKTTQTTNSSSLSSGSKAAMQRLGGGLAVGRVAHASIAASLAKDCQAFVSRRPPESYTVLFVGL